MAIHPTSAAHIYFQNQTHKMSNISETRNRLETYQQLLTKMNEAKSKALPSVKEGSSSSGLNATHGVKHRPSYLNANLPKSITYFLDTTVQARNMSIEVLKGPRLLEIHWYRSSEIPEQQSIVLTFAHFRRSEQRFWLRTHRELASLTTEYSFITPLHVVLLLRHLRERLRDYDSITFQSWWYASCIWEAVASWMKQAGSQATFHYYSTSDIQIPEIQSPALPAATGNDYEWEATSFSKNRLEFYLGTVKFAGYDAHRKEYVKFDLDTVRLYCSEGLLNEALRLAQTNDLMRKKFAMLHTILQSEGRHDKEFNGIAYTTL
ncbi:hypothetical protein BDQ12DRAFT_665516 [Crucibulum laeve]|uniref:Uncharacterized protein n=1 Tax=Crucibulum laeve TaxID=68775 RepID=A0A5C3M1S6_9AGAR|nr:hypothetical protein BDQ12DRAFT_665516 [Crucibulum laeve]